MSNQLIAGWVFLLGFLLWVPQVEAHHVLGRPSYSVNEDSNTPSSMQIETQIGQYTVVITVFPAFPKPGRLTVVKLYATHTKTNASFPGPVHFFVLDDVWFGGTPEEQIGTQERPNLDGGIFKQGLAFEKEGFYIISARFEYGDEPYVIDIPVQIGSPKSFDQILIAVGVVVLVLATVALIKRAKRKRRLERINRVTQSRNSSSE